MWKQPKTKFKLSDEFVNGYATKQPPWGPLGYFVTKRTYARKIDDRTEEWHEIIRRVVEGAFTILQEHTRRNHLPEFSGLENLAHTMYNKMFNMKFLPPGRGLWAMGTDMLWDKGSAALNNCAFVTTQGLKDDPSAPFEFLMDMSMLGVGVGSDVRGADTVHILKPRMSTKSFVVKDSREGWVELLRVVLRAYFGRGKMPATIDYSKVRPYGSPIQGFGGVASGPEPLQTLVREISELLDARIGDSLRGCDIVDIFNYIGKCVVAGNVRRTAEIMFGEPTDQEFLSLKDNSTLDALYAQRSTIDPADAEALSAIDAQIAAHPLLTRRWASNNSVFATKGMDYDAIAPHIIKNGEPGLIYLDNAHSFGRISETVPFKKDRDTMGTNPCGEQFLESFELCNLVETFPSLHNDLSEYLQTLESAMLYAKIVTLLPTHDPRTNAVMLRNRRIGIGMSGIVQAIAKFGKDSFIQMCDNGYVFLRALDEQMSETLCVRESIRLTTVKPSGTVSLIPGVTPGVHYDHSEYYIRNVRISKDSPLLEHYKSAGYKTEPCVYQPGSVVISFPIKSANFERSKDEVSMREQIELINLMQTWWSDNSVSCTVTFNKIEASDIAQALRDYEGSLKSISFLPLSEHGYQQAPYISITEQQYNDMTDEIRPMVIVVDTHEIDDKYCDGESCAL